MENRRLSQRAGMASIRTDFPDRGPASFDLTGSSARRSPVRIIVSRLRPRYAPGDPLDCSVRIEGQGAVEPMAAETSVIWSTSGKGDEDIGVHFWDRQSCVSEAGRHETVFHLSVKLPLSPHSYNGFLVKIRWFVQVRVTFADNSAYCERFLFTMAPATQSELPDAKLCS